MTGSCVLSNDYWVGVRRERSVREVFFLTFIVQRETVTVLLDTVARVHAELGITFEFINIGGGLGIPYRPGQVLHSGQGRLLAQTLPPVPQAEVELASLAPMIRAVIDERVATHGLPFKPVSKSVIRPCLL